MKLAWRVLAGFLILALIVWPVMYLKPLWVADQEVRFKLWREGVESKYVEAGGYKIHYLEARPSKGEAGTPLLLSVAQSPAVPAKVATRSSASCPQRA